MMVRSVSKLSGISGVPYQQGTLRSGLPQSLSRLCVCVMAGCFGIHCINVTLTLICDSYVEPHLVKSGLYYDVLYIVQLLMGYFTEAGY